MSQLDRTGEGLDDIWSVVREQWRAAQDVWLDAYRSEFESSFWFEIEDAVKMSLEDFRHFADVVERAKQRLE